MTLDSLQRTAIVHLNHTSPEELKDTICRLQPNVILTPGTLSFVLSALGWNNDDDTFHPYYLDSLHYVCFTEKTEKVPEALLLPYRYAYGVHLRSDLHLNPNLVSDGADLFVVRIRVHSPLWKEFLLHPLHFSQDMLPPTKEDGTSRIFQYKMYIADELICLFRGYGKQVEVLSPETIRHKINSY